MERKTEKGLPKEKCMHELFEAQVERAPESVAVVFEGKELTDGELNRRANQLANYLQKARARARSGGRPLPRTFCRYDHCAVSDSERPEARTCRWIPISP